MTADLDVETWTCGAEHELGDWPRERPLLDGWGVDERDVTVMNSDGTAADPKARITKVGGEWNSRPTPTVNDQLCEFSDMLEKFPEATVNHRSNLHVHWRVPGLREDLTALKRLQTYILLWGRDVVERVEPIPGPLESLASWAMDPSPHEAYFHKECYEGATRRYRRRRISHHTLLTAKRVKGQLEAKTPQEFFEAEVPRTKATGALMWHAQPRCAVNVRQLLETDTIEFRHWPGTLDVLELRTALTWCREFLVDALGDQLGLGHLWQQCDVSWLKFPTFPPYVHWREVRFRATVLDGTVPRETAAENVRQILAGTWCPTEEDKARAL